MVDHSSKEGLTVVKMLSGENIACENLFVFDGCYGKFLPFNFKESVNLKNIKLIKVQYTILKRT